MAKDIFHDTVKLALQKDGRTITHAPYRMRYDVHLIIYHSEQEVIAQWIE